MEEDAGAPFRALCTAAYEAAGWPQCTKKQEDELAACWNTAVGKQERGAAANIYGRYGEHLYYRHIYHMNYDLAAETLLGSAAARELFPTTDGHRLFLLGLFRGLFTVPDGTGLTYNTRWDREVLRRSLSAPFFSRLIATPIGGPAVAAGTGAEEPGAEYLRALFWAAVQVTTMPAEDRRFVHRDLIAPLLRGDTLPHRWKGFVVRNPTRLPPAVVGGALAAPFTRETVEYLRWAANGASTLAVRIADYVVFARHPYRDPSIQEGFFADDDDYGEKGAFAILDAFAAAALASSSTREKGKVWATPRGTNTMGGSVPGMRDRGTWLVVRILEAMPLCHADDAANQVHVSAVLDRASDLGILNPTDGSGQLAVFATMLGSIPDREQEGGTLSPPKSYRAKLIAVARHCAALHVSSSDGAVTARFPPRPERNAAARVVYREAVQEFCDRLASVPRISLKPAKRRRLNDEHFFS